MIDPETDDVDRKELEQALMVIREDWARGKRDVSSLYAIEAVLCRRSDNADRALSSAWWTLIGHLEKPEFLETLCALARATLEGNLALLRARRDVYRASKVALAAFEAKV